MKTKYVFIAFAVTALLQAFAPLKMVYDNEMTVSHGTVYKFKTEPIDPSDPFRGKYVSLNFEENILRVKDTVWQSNEQVYALLSINAAGFAKITAITKTRPQTGNDYIVVKTNYYFDGSLHINLPFDRFYMEEGKAQEAEDSYRDYSRQENTKPAYALVAVKEGNVVVTDVIVDGQPIRNYVLRKREE
ncbi:hypothetical protein Q765_19640 [Flavobacterium rivuli WB 3.3-2 = DSM 21788]|uniref:GDYXXLXY protein n=1 Tax=Flavobacterium rivuli WB 3.3-2 = DSM 21788 TaxID=1121895 RepID=A0A0A2M008_9FLAO|nr:GDYXXLXY domain-containing protein [Flavobacterium rivuli]KGO84798.1 hypothetical protein Q765_19640 [Flavobacterium rivuli WB 3.3-2 = DSM 21788]